MYVGQNEWLHLNCCLWSSIVFENMNGTLQNVFTALSYGRHLVSPHLLFGEQSLSVTRHCANLNL